ncbi:MAG: hypothetical protein WC779_08635, partial [Candidatus Omnitrophota bacterium]
MPKSLGTVRDSFRIPGDKEQIVFHIQDAHCNYAAQKKISEIIEYLNKNYGAKIVNLEGGADSYDISIFTDIADKDMRYKASDKFVKDGLVNGAEYFAVNNPEKIELWGIDDPSLYLENLRTYRESLKYKDFSDNSLKSLSYVLSSLKAKIYGKDLLALDLKYSQYKAGNIEFKGYACYLLGEADKLGLDTKAFPNISKFSEIFSLETGLDFNKANDERDRLIDKLHRSLSRVELEELVRNTV